MLILCAKIHIEIFWNTLKGDLYVRVFYFTSSLMIDFFAIVIHYSIELFVVSSFSISCPCLRAKVAWPWATILFLVVLSFPRVFLKAQSFLPISSWCRYPCKSGIWPFWCTSCTSWSLPIVPASTFHRKYVEAKIEHTAIKLCQNQNESFHSRLAFKLILKAVQQHPTCPSL